MYSDLPAAPSDERATLEVDDLSGLWTRSLIAWPDGRRDVTSQVAWLQGIGTFVDLRRPTSLGHFDHARCLNHLTIADCTRLAAQQGFAGVFVKRDEAFEWLRLIDYQPGQGRRDIGRLFWQGAILVEEGLEADYIEHWHRDPGFGLRPRAAVTLRAVEDGRWGCLLRVGNLFMLARDRQVSLAGGTLAEAVAGAETLRAAQALVDCELSLGTISGDVWRITRSSLPFRENANVTSATQGSAGLRVADLDSDGTPIMRRWEITASEGDLAGLLNREPPDGL